MNEALQIVLHSDPLVLTALAGLIGVFGWCTKQIVAALATAIREWSAARAKVTVAEVEIEKAEKETTGRFVTLAEKDRQQIDSLVADVRAQLKRCDEERKADRAEYEAEIAKLRGRVDVLERSRAALWRELQDVRRAHASGGAYPMPPELPENVIEQNGENEHE